MNPLARALIALVIAFFVYCFSYWLSVAFLPFGPENPAPTLVALVLAALAGFFLWQGLAAGNAGAVLQTALLWAVIAGAVGFAAGFFGPMIFAPGANQGPLLGIFITGPAGFVLGGIAGLIRSAWRRAAT